MNGFGSDRLKSMALWMFIAVMAVVLYIHFQKTDKPTVLNLRQLEEYVQEGKIVDEVKDRGGTLSGKYKDEVGATKGFKVQYQQGQEDKIYELMEKHGVSYKVERASEFFWPLLNIIVPLVVILAVMFFIMRQLHAGGSKAMSFGKSRARRVMEGETGVTFDDVAGCDEAKEDLCEIVDFLKDPQKYTRLGAKIPRGCLLVGPPGTGKTLLARAVAGEAKVPFFSISGSDFVEMFVGVGAARVRDLFEQSKKHKPSLIFIDEIDAVGRQRFAGVGGGHDEREQTLNQLLVEMDGFDPNEGVILLAGTNRPDVLDKALLRPGRFDRQIVVDMPDLRGREAILKIHARSVKMASDVDLRRIARATPGFSGAHLENVVNESALLAARQSKEMVEQADLENAKDRVFMGPERKSMILNEKEKEMTAYHEAGHALVAYLLPDADPVHKVSIIPRGRALGVTAIHALEDRHSHSEKQLKATLAYALGGRVAEGIKFGEFTTGASNDLQKVTELSRKMVCEFGMSDRLGSRTFGHSGEEVFYARDQSREPAYSESTAGIIDDEIKRLVDEATETAERLLAGDDGVLERVAQALIERETIDSKELAMLVEGKELPPLFQTPPEPPQPKEEAPQAAPEKAQKPRPEIGLDPRPGLSPP